MRFALHNRDFPVAAPVEMMACESRSVGIGGADAADLKAAGIGIQQNHRNGERGEPLHIRPGNIRTRHPDDRSVVAVNRKRGNLSVLRRQHHAAQFPAFVRFRVGAGHAVPFERHLARPVRHGEKDLVRVRATGHAAEDSDLRNPVDQPVCLEPVEHLIQHAAVAFELIHQLPGRKKLRPGREIVKLPIQRLIQLLNLRFKFHSSVFPIAFHRYYTKNAQFSQQLRVIFI